MATTPTTPPDIADLSTPPNRLGASDTVFVAAVDTFFGELPTFGTEQNTLADWEYSTATEVYNNALEAESSANDSASSAADSLTYSQDSASSVNYQGEWSSLTGAYSKGISVTNNGAFWRLKVDLADITASEPTVSNSNWQFSSGTRWQVITDTSFTAARNAMYHARTDTPGTSVSLPSFSKNDFLVVSADVDNTAAVRVINAAYTIVGSKKSSMPGDQILLLSGQVLSVVAIDSNTLKIVGK